MSALSLEFASKHYAGTPALEKVSVDFAPGLITAVIGPSGCGKSTLLKLCNGLVRPDSGQVRLFGEPIDYAALPVLRRRLGYAVQGNILFPHLTARENITLLARLEGWGPVQIRERLDELLSLSQLETAQLDRHPHQLSGGQQQRVGLCRAMMLRPDVLLLDEPFGAIDPITRRDIQQQMLALQRAEPRTSVLVTHDMGEALTLADHVLVMGDGRILHSKDKRELMRRRPGEDAQELLHALLAGENA